MVIMCPHINDYFSWKVQLKFKSAQTCFESIKAWPEVYSSKWNLWMASAQLWCGLLSAAVLKGLWTLTKSDSWTSDSHCDSNMSSFHSNKVWAGRTCQRHTHRAWCEPFFVSTQHWLLHLCCCDVVSNQKHKATHEKISIIFIVITDLFTVGFPHFNCLKCK